MRRPGDDRQLIARWRFAATTVDPAASIHSSRALRPSSILEFKVRMRFPAAMR